MPLDHRVLASAIQVFSAGSFEGSASIVSVPTEAGRSWPYLVTAHHVSQAVELTVRVPDPLEPAKLSPPVEVPTWWQPFQGVDLAITPFPWWKVERYQATPLADFIPEGRVPALGAPVYYVGVFGPWGVPMARAGTIAALDVTVKTQGGYEFPADIVDCRSYRGFSGSAVFGTLAYAELRPTPNPPAAALAQGHDEPPPLGRISHAASFAGVFTAHLSDEDDDRDIPASRYGMGIMVPCDYVREALMTETLKDQRERAAREMADREAQEGAPIEEALMASEFDRFEDLAKQLVNTPKPQS
jgi:hypothetical protein